MTDLIRKTEAYFEAKRAIALAEEAAPLTSSRRLGTAAMAVQKVAA